MFEGTCAGNFKLELFILAYPCRYMNCSTRNGLDANAFFFFEAIVITRIFSGGGSLFSQGGWPENLLTSLRTILLIILKYSG